MKAFELPAPDLAQLRLVDRPEPPAPKGREVLLRMRAASFNFIDVAVARGLYPVAIYPNVPIADGAGEVIAVGEAVEDLKPGDRVALHPKAAWFGGKPNRERTSTMRGVTVPGALEEFKIVDMASAVKAPDHLSWEQIASIPIVFTTGWNGLVAGETGPGSTVVVLGTGGSSLAALQLAKSRGSRVIITSSSDERLDQAKALGADVGINYRSNPDWHERVRELTNGIGADLVLETAGSETFGKSLQSVRHGGTVFTIGFLSGGAAEADLLTIIVNALRVIGWNTGSSDDLRQAMAAIESAKIQPVVGHIFSLSEVAEAYAVFGAGGHFGKTTLRLDW